jgi:hypothetical protein
MTDPHGTPEPPAVPLREVCSVAAARLGDRGDINRSYSADVIAIAGRIRNPFQHQGSFWVCTSISGRGLTESGETEHEAYRLTPAPKFIGVATTYAATIATAEAAEAARNNPHGFYHGITVKHGSEAFIMSGPPLRFIPDKTPARPEPDTPEPLQLDLF